MKQQPNKAQLKALKDFSKLHGRNWKSVLRTAWLNGNYRGFEDSHYLQQIRNSFGPSWLQRFVFPEAKAAGAPEFFVPQPVATGEITAAGMTVYRSDDGEQLMWSGAFPLPNIGDRVTILLNGIGEAVVKGYFAEAGYLGVLTKALNPPAWLRRQQAESDDSDIPKDIGCEFGTEIAIPVAGGVK